MDSRENPATKKNSQNVDCDSESSKNYKSDSPHVTVKEIIGNVSTSTIQSSNSASNNDLRLGQVNPLSNIDFSLPVNRNSDEPTSSFSGSQKLKCNKANCSTEKSEVVISSDKTIPNVKVNQSDSNSIQPVFQQYKACSNVADNGCSRPSTSGLSNAGESDSKENGKRPTSLNLKGPYLDNDNSSDTENDDYSLGSEDGCIYTYRGGEHLADLPSSFFSLDMGLPRDKHLPIPPNYNVPQQPPREQGSRASSPDMDFLEMDFDPGPSCEADTGDESNTDADLEVANNMLEESLPEFREATPEIAAGGSGVKHEFNNPPVIAASTSNDAHSVPSTSHSADHGDTSENVHSYGPYITHVNNSGEELLVRRTMCHRHTSVPVNYHASGGELITSVDILDSFARTMISLGDEQPDVDFDSLDFSPAAFHITMGQNIIPETVKSENEAHSVYLAADVSGEPSTSARTAGTRCVSPPRCMIWPEEEACERQVTQIATSACGATAIVNVFNALGVPVNLEKINSAVGTRQRANNAPLPRYIFSRAVAGCTAADLVSSIHHASDGLVSARFFPTYPERAVSLSHWLADWISLGAVPILTLNLQVGCEGKIPDAWHHQMVFGISSSGVYLSNPLECVRENVLWPRLTSPSVLLLRACDVLSHWVPEVDLTPLMYVPDRRFHSFNVIGQVANLLREYRAAGWSKDITKTRHIRIPASYQAGVTVAALTGSEAHRRLTLAAQLPILSPQNNQ